MIRARLLEAILLIERTALDLTTPGADRALLCSRLAQAARLVQTAQQDLVPPEVVTNE
jgi:hypothetical protein